MLSFPTRLLFFKLCSFAACSDLNRTIYFLVQHLRARYGAFPEEKSLSKVNKQKVKLNRAHLLDSARKVFSQNLSKRAFLEVEYVHEEGTGLGPTLEFYYLVSKELRDIKALWHETSDHSLFPSPLQVSVAKGVTEEKVRELFEFAGTLVAKSIADERLVDLPFSSVFWDRVCSKKLTIYDIERMDEALGKHLRDFLKVHRRYE